MLDLISKFISDYSDWLTYLALASIVFLILSILFIPKMIARIPHDYFIQPQHRPRSKPISILQFGVFIVKNLLGVVLIISGILMLVLPGQGLLTLFAGILLLNFPGKYKLERYLIRKPAIKNSINWIRRKQNVPELDVD